MTLSDRDKILVEIWNKSLHAYGTSYLYERRFKMYRGLIRVLTFSGLAVPIAIGGIYMGYNSNQELLKWSLIIGGGIAVIQLLFSLLALTNSWSDSLSASSESKAANYDLFREFEQLTKFPPTNDDEILNKYSILTTIERAREQQDAKNPLSEKEQRRGMRWALRYFNRPCVTCGQIPTSMTPSNCDTCGNF